MDAAEIKTRIREKMREERERKIEETVRMVVETLQSHDKSDGEYLGYTLPFKKRWSGIYKWALYLDDYNLFEPPEKARIVYPEHMDFSPVVETVEKKFDDGYLELSNCVDVFADPEEFEEEFGFVDASTAKILNETSDARSVINTLAEKGEIKKCWKKALEPAIKILTEKDKIKKEWRRVLEPVYPGELDKIKSIVFGNKSWDPWDDCEISEIGYEACKCLFESDIDMDLDCRYSYQKIVETYEKFIGELKPRGKITVIKQPDVIEMYINNHYGLKDWIVEADEKTVLQVLKEIAKLEKRNEDVDKWLMKKYPELSKKAARRVV